MDEELRVTFTLEEEQPIDCIFRIDATTFDYEQLDKQPQINGETLIGNKTSEELHLASAQDIITLEQNIQNEATTRAENDTLLQNNINTLDEKVDGINANLTQQIEETQQDVNDKYNELIRDIDDLTDVVEEDYSTLNQRITDVADELNQTIEENVVTLQQEDTALQNQINAHSTTLTAYDTRITNNANAITQEITDRQNSDDNLQEQIDGITAGSDVKDIVGTYAELQAYDKSTLGDNDIIKVLQDETQENASTYYRYVASTQSFAYIGKEGPFYTKSETDVLLNAKQNTIDDLVTIRNNASDGKVASDTIATYGDIVTHNANEFATTTALTQGLATKQATISDLSTIRSNANNSVQYNTITSKGLYLATHPELSTASTIIPFIHNDIAYLTQRGGSYTITRDGTPLSLPNSPNMFSGKPNYLILDGSTGTEWVIDITLPPNVEGQTNKYMYGNLTYIDFGRANWSAKYIKVEYQLRDSDTYTQAKLEQNNSASAVYVYISAGSVGLNALRITLREPLTTTTTSGFRIAQIGVINYQSNGSQSTLLGLGGGTLYGDVNFASGKLVNYVKNTDYATSSTGGVVKTTSTYATATTSSGNIYAQTISLANYPNRDNGLFISKGTLENIKESLVTSVGDGKYSTLEQYNYLDEKVRDIELFKFPNAVIIGEPTIQNGQVSDFSTVSYLQFPFILDLHNQAFQIDFCFTTATNVQTQQNILDSNFGLALAIQNGKGVMAISSNGTSWDIGSATGSINIQSNTTYYARLIWNRLQYKTQLSTDGVNYVDDMVIVDTRSPYPRTMFIGGCDQLETGHAGHPFLGTINMNKASLSIMGNVIWQGMDDAGLATRADLSLSNLDELGEARFGAKLNKPIYIAELETLDFGGVN